MEFAVKTRVISVSMIYFFLFSWLSLISFSSAATATSKLGNETDRLALLRFKAKITRDPFQVLRSWNDSTHFCKWQGVTCGRRHQRVIQLDLRFQKLEGSISPHIGNLSFLRELQLHQNSFTEEIPPEIGRLSRLQYLRLDQNLIGGEIPAAISNCSNLIYINVSLNWLAGRIPEELGSLSKLEILYIHDNNLTGIIPSSFGNLSSLQIFSATNNSIVGEIPDALCQLKNLIGISLNINNISGTIPLPCFNHSSLQVLDFSDNQIHGTLPTDLGFTLPNIRALGVGGNQLTGTFPPSISNASNLEVFSSSRSKLTGKLPSFENLHKLRRFIVSSNELGTGDVEDSSFLSSLIYAPDLEVLALNNNNFGGILPENIGNFSTTLRMLLLDSNNFSGSIPTGIGNLVSLQRLDLWNNQLSGEIPEDLGKLQKLVHISLSGNKLSGKIPSSLGRLKNLLILRLARNDFQGSIPSSLGECQKLLNLDLSANNLTGRIPPQIFGLSFLSISLNLSHNLLSGPIPIEVGNLQNLGALDLSYNNLSGEIPSSLGSCIALDLLLLSRNSLEGVIPSSLSSLRGIKFLSLSYNNLSGRIPQFLAQLDLHYLNISYNNFEGVLPVDGAFHNSSRIFVDGNTELCGGIPELKLPICPSNKRRLTRKLKMVIATVSGIIGVILVVSFLVIFWLIKRRKEATSNSSEYSLLKMSYQSLLKATDGFSSANLIGVGSFGSVYRGTLDQGTTVIAVKVLNLSRRGASKSFMAECEALRNIRHRNLVKILTACSGIDYPGNDFKALVYEFMVNGSLEEWLHPNRGIEEANEAASRSLDLAQRLNIAIDVASALDYLHHDCEIPIVHCDLKPSNVLLDTEMIGHVGDFGLAKFLPEVTSNSSTHQSSSDGIRGTVGYAAPEYGMGSEVSTQGDVYSFGILLLEMFTGKRPTDEMFAGNLNLHNFVKEALPERIYEIVDPLLLVEREEGETSEANAQNRRRRRTENIYSVAESLVLILEIGVICSSEIPRERMNMEEVAAQLLSIRNKLVQTPTSGERQPIAMHIVQVEPRTN